MSIALNSPLMGNSALFDVNERSRHSHGTHQGLQDVIRQLMQALLQGGKNPDSGLAQMVKDQLANNSGGLGASRGSPEEMLTRALQQLISEKLGDDFGQTNAGGILGNEAAVGGQPRLGPAGSSDLLERVLSGLAESSLSGILKPDGEGSRFEQKDAGMMREVATFMDANPNQFPPPDSGSWGNELIEDKYLNKSETESFKSAITMISGQLEAKASGQVSGDATTQGFAPTQGLLGGPGGLGGISGVIDNNKAGDALRQVTEMVTEVASGLQQLTKRLDLESLGQSAMQAANSIVGLMLPGAR